MWREIADFAQRFVSPQKPIPQRQSVIADHLRLRSRVDLGDLDAVWTDLVAYPAGRTIVDRVIGAMRLSDSAETLRLWA